jgi:Putative zinc-finger
MDNPMTTPFDTDDPWASRLSEYLDGTLREHEARELEAHLQSCERCRTSLAELSAVVERLRADPMDDAPTDAWARIASRLAPDVAYTPRTVRAGIRGYAGGVESRTLRRITAAAALSVTFVGGIWAGATLCLAGSAWTPPGWMHILPRGQSLPRRVQRTFPPFAADSVLEQWAPLRRSIADLDVEIARATRALENEPGNKTLERLIQQLKREQNDLRAVLDSASASVLTPHR